MRLVMDLQACQTEASRHRGVARYALSFAAHLSRLNNGLDLRFTYSEAYPHAVDEILNVIERQVSRQRATGYSYPSLQRTYPGERNTMTRIADALINQHWLSLQPDILLISHVFEGYTGEAITPHRLPKIPGLLRSTILYDLIPLRFPNIYFEDLLFQKWYLEKLGALRDCDLVLAISESSRSDAIELLNIHPEKIVTIWGGIDSHFRQKDMQPTEQAAFREKFKLRGRFVLFTGGDEYRKNIEGAIAGFARLPPETRRGVQLVVVCNMDPGRRTLYLEKVVRHGLTVDDVLFTGFVSEEDLVTFYNLCEVFVYPSLYEGLGLPVLEAMACGAPVIAANNSSICEIVVREDALFDTKNPEALAERLSAVLSNTNFREDLKCYGPQRAKAFTWERTAKLAAQAFQEADSRLNAGCSISLAKALTKKRLALFTPLPPCRSGIADYIAAFLPFLAQYFDIEIFIDSYKAEQPYIEANFPIHSHEKFSKVAEQFDVVMYEMGNSEFHAYMLNYIERHPGIVMLHDAYLSGLYGYLEFYVHHTGRYFREMLESHGPRARRFFAPVQQTQDPVSQAMIKLPCTKKILDNAIGIISHSPFNLEVARTNYPEGWAAPYRIINQMVRIPAMQSAQAKKSLRTELGFEDDDFIVCTFGHIAWTKCGDLVLQAFEQSFIANRNAKLIFVGELAKDDFGEKLKNVIQQSIFKNRVRITGFLKVAEYEKYLAIANLAVQLRQHSRGGTPKGVLDCLAYGVPVIVNNNASYIDYPADVMIKLSANPTANELAEKFNLLSASSSNLRNIAIAGRSYVEKYHHPELVASQYAITIEEFATRHSSISLKCRIKEIGGVLASSADGALKMEDAARAMYRDMSHRPFTRQRILIDVSHLAESDHGTGIPRVVRGIVRWLYCAARAGFEPVAVRLSAGGLVRAVSWLEAEGLLAVTEKDSSEMKLDFQSGDILLMLDSSWQRIDEFLPIYKLIQEVEGRICTVIYDLLPITLPPEYFVPGGPQWFKGWLEKAVQHSDALVCISKASAEEVHEFIKTHLSILRRPLDIGYWHLGCDFNVAAPVEDTPTARMKEAMAKPGFLMVGTLEPRKGHRLALEAMEILWARGISIGLCIAGKKGWMVDELMGRIAHHPELDKKFYYIDKPTDDELQYAYSHALALLFPSAGEGFGLPLIEAARFGTPIIASDLPVLREIAGAHATYFSLGTALELANTLEQWLKNANSGTIPDSRKIACLTWEQSAEQLLDVVLGNQWYKSL